jgi:hypothetical protein
MKNKNKVPNTLWQTFRNSKDYKSKLYDVISSDEEVKMFKQDFIIHGLAIKTTNSEGK